MSAMPGTLPEGMPILTYVAKGPNPNNFLRRARDFHKSYGLAPVSVDSLESVVDDLSQRVGIKERIRIVTHASASSMTFALFRGGPRIGLEANWLTALARSDAEGLAALVGNLVDLSGTSGSPLGEILTELRNGLPATLQPFGLDASGTPTGDLFSLFQRSAELMALDQMQQNDSDVRLLIRAVEFILSESEDGLRVRIHSVSGVSLAAIQDLELAIRGLNLPLQSSVAIPLDSDYRKNLRTALNAFTRAQAAERFRHRLTLARKRLDANSHIDIRGCHAGKDPDYLRAVAVFFGDGNTTKPHVSGPDRFQSFHRASSVNKRTVDEVAGVAGDPGVAEALAHWATLTGRPQFSHDLVSYLDRFALLVPDRNSGTGLHTGLIDAIVMGDLHSGSGFLAVNDLIDSLWNGPMPSEASAAISNAKGQWSLENRAAWFACLSEKLDHSDPNQKIFVSPDPEYAAHIIEV